VPSGRSANVNDAWRHLIVRGLQIGIPAVLIGLWWGSQRRRARQNADLSAMLRDRGE
jgi:hypothetical protein